MNMKTLAVIFLAATTLAACHPKSKDMAGGTTPPPTPDPTTDPTTNPPGNTGDGSTQSDPNKVVTTDSKLSYDLRWGTKDADGPSFVKYFDTQSGQYQIPVSVPLFGGEFASAQCSGTASCGPVLKAPHADVLAAWNSGWTGKGINVLTIDTFGAQNADGKTRDPHAALLALTTQSIAWGAGSYGMNRNDTTAVYNSDNSKIGLASLPSMSVVTFTFDYDLASHITVKGKFITDPNQWTGAQLRGSRTDFTADASKYAGLVNSTTALADAVIVKSAGDYNTQASGSYFDAQYEPLNYILADDLGTAPRLLIVGALDKSGSPDARAKIRDDSNVAGDITKIKSRFLVASGELPFETKGLSYDGKSVDAPSGTQIAASRVAAYAAIVRQKFPNLNATQIADIFLQTARTDTLACAPNCDTAANRAIYGAGEASLANALSPVGKLK